MRNLQNQTKLPETSSPKKKQKIDVSESTQKLRSFWQDIRELLKQAKERHAEVNTFRGKKSSTTHEKIRTAIQQDKEFKNLVTILIRMIEKIKELDSIADDAFHELDKIKKHVAVPMKESSYSDILTSIEKIFYAFSPPHIKKPNGLEDKKEYDEWIRIRDKVKSLINSEKKNHGEIQDTLARLIDYTHTYMKSVIGKFQKEMKPKQEYIDLLHRF